MADVTPAAPGDAQKGIGAGVPETFEDILALFPSLIGLSKVIGVPYGTIASWRSRGSIPERRWRSIEQASRQLGVKGVTYSRLAKAAENGRQGAA